MAEIEWRSGGPVLTREMYEKWQEEWRPPVDFSALCEADWQVILAQRSEYALRDAGCWRESLEAKRTAEPELAAQPLHRYENGSIDPKTDTRFDRLPWGALLKAARTMKHGMKYETDKDENWRGVPAHVHLDHALRHIALWLAGDRSEDHVGHALNRLLMWAELVE